jgi:hypothetical protein
VKDIIKRKIANISRTRALHALKKSQKCYICLEAGGGGGHHLTDCVMNKVKMNCRTRMVSKFKTNASFLCDTTSVATVVHKKYSLHRSPDVFLTIY